MERRPPAPGSLSADDSDNLAGRDGRLVTAIASVVALVAAVALPTIIRSITLTSRIATVPVGRV
jgi:predicted RNA-binding protein YlqC (UPF0109 family)